MANEKNTLDFSALSEYIDERKDELFVKSAVGAKTLDRDAIELMLGVKNKQNLNYLDSEIVLAPGECGWNPQGSDTFYNRTIEAVPVEVEKEFCALSMREYWMNWQLKIAAGRETLAFEDKIIESNMAAIADALEELVWNGDQTLGIDGWLKVIEDDGTNNVLEIADGSTATQAIDAVVAALTPRMLAKGVALFVSPEMYRNYIMESNSTCCASRPVIDAASDSITYFGDSRITIYPTQGLSTSQDVVAASKGNLVYATDIENSESIYEMWFERLAQTFNLRVLFNAGVNIKFVDEVVLAKPEE